MLAHLRVANLGVLDDAPIDPSDRFTVITGETGAGKTLLLGGLRLILGGQADSGAVGPFADQASVDGLFATEGGEIGASRVVPGVGRSRAYLEGSIVSAATLSERLGSLVEIVGQHDQLSITRPSHLLELIDGSLDESGLSARGAYRVAWSDLQAALERQRQLGGDQIELARELDLARYQSSEIASAGLEPGLDDELEAGVSRLRNVEEIRDHLAETMQLTDRISESVGELVARLRKAAGLDPAMATLGTDAEGVAALVADIAREARSSADHLEADPSLLTELEDRLTALGELKRKYGRTLDEVIAYGARTSERVDELESLMADADRVESWISEARSKVDARAARLSEIRSQAAREISSRMMGHLGDLGLGSGVVEFDMAAADAGPAGADRIELSFSSDIRLVPGPVGAVASGGELSRLVLALRLATRSRSTRTLVFDEVDTGIGGRTALAMGRKLAELAGSGQVLCVTHLPQVAAYADRHYVVERDGRSVARVRLVEGEERVSEITRMLAGQPESEAGKSAAAELLASAGK
jgi:DNA repair protein RecN (Recombination protein N)